MPYALGALLSLPMAQAMALGFGRVTNLTALGQTLNFVVGVRLDADDNLVPECLSVEVFSGESRLPSTALRVTIEPGGEASERSLRIISSAPIDEPVVSVNLQIACPNRLARKFVAFIDPPLTAPSLPVVAAAPAAAVPTAVPPARTVARAVRSEPASAPDGAAATTASPTKSVARPRRAVAANGDTPASGAASSRRAVARPAKPSPTTSKLATASRAPAPAGARLKLEATEDDAARERPALRLTSTLTPAAATASGAASAPLDEDVAQRARERERLQTLEQSLTQLRAESQANKTSLALLQARLAEAQAQREANPLVLTLAALAALLAAAVAWLLWQRRADRLAAAQWWARPVDTPTRAAHGDAVDSGPDRGDDEPWVARRPAIDEPPTVETTASPMLLTQIHAAAQAEADAAAAAAAAEPAQELSVEELIDLEQQAEFFVVLGQDEAAIDLLMGHLRSSGGASPLPYLKLLEIYRRREDREAYERIRERFNRRFNAYAQDWQTDPHEGRTLVDYPHVIARLQSLWATPRQTMQALEASLFRRDAGSSTFDLPAYRELLFLYAVARDLSERETPSEGVDLLLPIGAEADAGPSMTRLHPSPSVEGPHERTAVDVDITRLDAGPTGDDDRPSRFHTDFGPTSGYLGLPGEAPRASR